MLPTVPSHALVVCGSDTVLQMGLRRGEGEGDAVTVYDVGNVEGFQHIAARMPSASFTALPDTTHFLCMVQCAGCCSMLVLPPLTAGTRTTPQEDPDSVAQLIGKHVCD